MRVDISRQVMAAGIDISPESHVSGLPNSKRRTYRLRCDLYWGLCSKHFQILQENADKELPDAPDPWLPKVDCWTWCVQPFPRSDHARNCSCFAWNQTSSVFIVSLCFGPQKFEEYVFIVMEHLRLHILLVEIGMSPRCILPHAAFRSQESRELRLTMVCRTFRTSLQCSLAKSRRISASAGRWSALTKSWKITFVFSNTRMNARGSKKMKDWCSLVYLQIKTPCLKWLVETYEAFREDNWWLK